MTTIHLNEYIGENFITAICGCQFEVFIKGVIYDPDLYENPVYVGDSVISLNGIRISDNHWNHDILDFNKKVENGFFVKE